MRRIQFDEFEIDLDLFTLSKKGEQIDIGPRALDLLVYLIENHDHVVSRDSLQRDVWKAKSLSAATIPTAIMEIRRVLGDAANDPSFISSTRGRGYRFVAQIKSTLPGQKDRLDTKTRLSFVGRSVETRALRQCLTQMNSHRSGRVVLISGAAGIGKTRLLEEFLLTVSPRTKRIAVKSPNLEGSPPFWLWTSLLRQALTLDPTNDSLRKNAQTLATAFPEIIETTTAEYDRENLLSRFSIITKWIETVKAIPNGEPILITFEDIHRSDPDSLALLSCLAEEIEDERVLLIATHRPPVLDDQRNERIAEVATLSNTLRVELGPLTSEDISAMLPPLQDDSEKLSQTLREKTAGNAFYVTQLIRFLASPYSIGRPEAFLSGLPLSGSEIVSRQLSDLPPATRKSLSLASALGDRFSVELFASVAQESKQETIKSLGPAKRAWIIKEEGVEYSFTHSLLREALYQTLDSSTKRELHLAVATVLIGRRDISSRSAEASYHLALALPLSDPNEARSYAVQAGQEAASRFAYSEAATFYSRALDIERSNPKAQADVLCDVMQQLAKAKLYAHDRQGARELLLNAAELAREINSAPHLASCALALAPDFLTIEVGVNDTELLDLLRESLNALPNGDTPLRAQLLARLSQAGQWFEPADHTEKVAIDALNCARLTDDKSALIAALAARAESLHGPAFAKKRLPFIAQLGELARAHRDTGATLLHHTRSITANLELGKIRDVEIHNEMHRNISSKTKLPQYSWYPKATDAMLCMMRGKIREAELLSNDFLEEAGDHRDQNVLQTFACHSVLRSIENDRSVDAIPLVAAFASQQKGMYVWAAALPWLYWDSGDISSAQLCLDRFSRSEIASMSREPGGGVGLGLLSEVSSALGHQEHIRTLYKLVTPIASGCSTVGYGVAYLGSFYRYSGLLAKAMGNTGEAYEFMLSACKREREIGAPSWHAYSVAELRALAPELDIPPDDLNFIERNLDPSSLPRASRLLAESGLATPSKKIPNSSARQVTREGR